MKNISILDLGMSNIYSIEGLFRRIGCKINIIKNNKDIDKAKIIVVPGVGSFPAAMNYLNKKNFIKKIQTYVKDGRPLIGICLGMQLLFEKSFEFGSNEGLGLLEGEVVGFNNSKLKTHIGWNKVKFKKNNFFYKNLKKDQKFDLENNYYYFVHSFYPVPKNEDMILSNSNFYGENFCSSICISNILALQFHPEKSSIDGIRLINNFLNLLDSDD
tara:strand:+ start:2089 stop:2733 length:645 start_codon:yes stop_codon:yes gene_type:complete